MSRQATIPRRRIWATPMSRRTQLHGTEFYRDWKKKEIWFLNEIHAALDHHNYLLAKNLIVPFFIQFQDHLKDSEQPLGRRLHIINDGDEQILKLENAFRLLMGETMFRRQTEHLLTATMERLNFTLQWMADQMWGLHYKYANHDNSDIEDDEGEDDDTLDSENNYGGLWNFGELYADND